LAQKEKAMTDQQEIAALKKEVKDLKRALTETQLGAAGIGVCLAQYLAESDPELRTRLNDIAGKWCDILENREEWDARKVLYIFAKAVIDPEFPKFVSAS
jgi:hypothetical protein